MVYWLLVLGYISIFLQILDFVEAHDVLLHILEYNILENVLLLLKKTDTWKFRIKYIRLVQVLKRLVIVECDILKPMLYHHGGNFGVQGNEMLIVFQ